MTIRYDEGPKQDLTIHFYARGELTDLTAGTFDHVMAPRERVIARTPPAVGSWTQWEAIWRRR